LKLKKALFFPFLINAYRRYMLILLHTVRPYRWTVIEGELQDALAKF
jgi:hypothetical protein